MQVHPKAVEKIVLLAPPKTPTAETSIDNNGNDVGKAAQTPDQFDTEEIIESVTSKEKNSPAANQSGKPATKETAEKGKKAALPKQAGAKKGLLHKSKAAAKSAATKKTIKKTVKGKTATAPQKAKAKKVQKKTKK
jgi:hypothetical protein